MPITNTPASYVTSTTPVLRSSDLPSPAELPLELNPELLRLLIQQATSQLPSITANVAPSPTVPQNFFQRLKQLPSKIPIVRGAQQGVKTVLSTAGEIGSNIANKPLKALHIPGAGSVQEITAGYKTGREEIGKGINFLGNKALDTAVYPFRKLGLYDDGKTNRPPTTATNSFRLTQ